jgi:hypothetical protein
MKSFPSSLASINVRISVSSISVVEHIFVSYTNNHCSMSKTTFNFTFLIKADVPYYNLHDLSKPYDRFKPSLYVN